MMAGDEFYDDGITSVMDPLAAADFRRDELKHTSSCPKCGSREPVRIDAMGCSDCQEYPRCGICGRWVGDGSGWLPGYVNTLDGNDEPIKVCTFCYGEAV